MSHLRAGIVILAAFLLQTTLPAALLASGIKPDFLLGAAAGVALVGGAGPAIGFGLVAGLMQDSFSGGLLGMNGFSKPLVVFVVARSRERPPLDSGVGVLILLLFACLADLAILWGLSEVAGFQDVPAQEFGAALLGIPLTVLFGALAYRVLRPGASGREVR